MAVKLMTFGTCRWPRNPERISRTYTHLLLRQEPPQGGFTLRDLGYGGCTLTLEGALPRGGQAAALLDRFRAGGADNLTLPDGTVLRAAFAEFELTESAREGYVSYRARFTEVPAGGFTP